jgi:hypothetical protein
MVVVDVEISVVKWEIGNPHLGAVSRQDDQGL